MNKLSPTQNTPALQATSFSVYILLLRSWHELVLFCVRKILWSKGKHAKARDIYTPPCRSHPISNSSNVFKKMSAVSLRTSFYVRDCRNDRVRKNGLSSISITTSFRDNLPSHRGNRLVLFTMAACVYRNAIGHAAHCIRQENSYGFGAGLLF